MITLCPNQNCGKRFEVDDSAIGKQVRCTECGQEFVITAPQPQQPAPAGPLKAAATGPRTPRIGARVLGRSLGFTPLGRLLLLAGLALVLLSRGCDSIGSRGVARAKAKLQYEQQEFQDRWEKKMADAENSQEKMKLREQRDKARSDLEDGKWADLQRNSRQAGTSNVIWAYWREWVFVIGTIVLAGGLVCVGSTTTGAERLIALIMIAIITFSVYIGGTAWLASVFHSIVGGVQSIGPSFR